MDSDLAIKVEHLSKKYCKDLSRSVKYGMRDIARNTLGMSSLPDKLRKDEFWAVDDVSFEVHKGEALGIIGPNGSGKTSILKLLNGIFWPDKGKVSIRGKVGALIEVGAGFHPLLTGRENIYVNAAILGMKKSEVEEQLDDIIKFADIGDFLDSPVRSYSSGMYVRLGFAVAVHCQPNILLVDEVLAVGDREFQLKCFRKMHELKMSEDVSLVLVSHNEYAIREFTTKCLVLEQGKRVYFGDSDSAISYYINSLTSMKTGLVHAAADISKERTSGGWRMDAIARPEGDIIKKVVFRDSRSNETERIYTGDKLEIDFHYQTSRRIKSPIFGLNVYNERGMFSGFWNSYEKVQLPDISGQGYVRAVVDPCDLPVDSYHCDAILCEEHESNVLEWKELPNALVVERPNDARGFQKLKQSWKVMPK